MEYALEGYGFSMARVVRAVLAQRAASGHADSELDERLWPLIEGDPERHPEDFIETVLEGLTGAAPPAIERPPELLSSLRARGGRGPARGLLLRVASATKAAFDSVQRGLPLRLIVCSLERDERGDEHLLLGVYAPSLSEDVQVFDRVSAGVLVALHRGREPGSARLEVLPRVYRKLCQNGAIVFEGNAPARELEPGLLWGAAALAPLARELERMIRACLDAKQFAQAVDSLRSSAEEPLEASALEAVLSAPLSPETLHAVLRRFGAAGDFSRWGLLNAVTAETRTAPSALMLHLERLGGALAGLSAGASAHAVHARAAAIPADMAWLLEHMDPATRSSPRLVKRSSAA